MWCTPGLSGRVLGTFIFCDSGHSGGHSSLALQLVTVNTLAEAKEGWWVVSGDYHLGLQLGSHPDLQCPLVARTSSAGGHPSLGKEVTPGPADPCREAGGCGWLSGSTPYFSAFLNMWEALKEAALSPIHLELIVLRMDVSEGGRWAESQDHCGCGGKRSI